MKFTLRSHFFSPSQSSTRTTSFTVVADFGMYFRLMIAVAATLHAQGKTEIATAADAA